MSGMATAAMVLTTCARTAGTATTITRVMVADTTARQVTDRPRASTVAATVVPPVAATAALLEAVMAALLVVAMADRKEDTVEVGTILRTQGSCAEHDRQ